MELTLLSVRSESIGYGRYGTRLHRELAALGVDVYDQLDPDPVVKPLPAAMLEDDGLGRRHKLTNVVAWVSVPTHARGWWQGQVPVISTMWETDTLPESFIENLHEFDTVVVPSDQNVELFSRYHPNVVKVPLGVDPQTWRYQARSRPGAYFNFLIGGSGARKGTDLAVKAFRKLWNREGSWGDGPEPRLILKSPRPEDLYGRGITRVGGLLSADEEVALYASAHCYLQPSRGEGFGLQPLQAIAQGCPTILTDAHGHADFAHLGYPLPWQMTKAGFFIYGPAGSWWEPNLDDLCDLMQLVYDNYDDACRHAAVSSTVALNQFTWSQTAAKFVEAVGPERMQTGYQGDGSWHQPEAKMYRVRLTRGWHADVAGASYQFQAGVDAWVPADVKRIMYEADLLDPDCLGVDSGLTAEQVTRLHPYLARHAYCETCNQKLGSGVTKADEIFAELEAAALT